MAVVTNYTALLPQTIASWTGGSVGQSVFLTYSFSTQANSYLAGIAPSSFQPLNEAEKSVVRAALQQWANVSGVVFRETTATEGELTFGFYDLNPRGATNVAGLGSFPQPGLTTSMPGRPSVVTNVYGQGGSVAFDLNYRNTPAFASDLLHLSLHEIGHALGLKHPFDPIGNTLAPALDTGNATVMSYTSPRASTLGPLDIAAIQYLYGRPGQPTPYGIEWSAATEGLSEYGTADAQAMRGTNGPDIIRSGGGRDAIWAGGGNDVVYAAGTGIEIDGGTGWDVVYTGVTFTPGMQLTGSGSIRTLYLPGTNDIQQFSNVESYQFNNGEYWADSNRFAYRDSPGTQTFASATGRDLLVLDEGRRGDTFVLSGGSITFGHNGSTDILRGLSEVRFIDGRMVFDSNDPAAVATRLYKAALGRLPDQSGLNYYISALQSGTPLSALAEGFAGSAEFRTRFGVGSNADFVLQIYRNVLGRAPDAAGLTYWRDALDSGRSTRGVTLASVSESAENKTLMAPSLATGIWDRNETAAQVARLYASGLGRAPDEAGLASWMRGLRSGETVLSVAANIVRSPEFRAAYDVLGSQDFVQALYRNTLGRAGDGAGVAYWAAVLNGGTSRADVLFAFSESPEHQARTAANITPEDPARYGIYLT